MKTSTHTPSNQTYSVSGLVVHAQPARLSDVETSLNAINGVEVHTTAPEGKLVVTVEEQAGQKTMIDTITQINNVSGVLSTALVYTHNDAWS